MSHEGTGFDSDDEMMQAYADESPAADFVKMTAKHTIDAGQLVTSADVKPRAAPVVRATDVSGVLARDPDHEDFVIEAEHHRFLSLADLLPEGVEGKRGRFRVVVSFEEER